MCCHGRRVLVKVMQLPVSLLQHLLGVLSVCHAAWLDFLAAVLATVASYLSCDALHPQVLAHEANLGYEDISNACVSKVDGVPVRNVRHLAQLIKDNSGPFLKIELDHAQLVVLDTSAIHSATADVMVDHSIPFDRSEDLRVAISDNSDENGAARDLAE